MRRNATGTRRRRKKKAAELTSLVDVLFILLFAALVQARGVAAHHDGATPVDEPRDAGTPGDASVEPGDAGMGSDAPIAADAGTTDAIVDDGGPDDGESYHARSLHAARTMASAVGNRPVAVIEITAAGQLTALTYWRDGDEIRRDEMSYPLLYQRPGDDEFEIDYRGKRNERHRLCAIVLDHFTGTTRPASNPGTRTDTAPHTNGAAKPSVDLDPGVVPGVVTSVDISQMVVLITLDAPRSELPWGLRRGLEFDMEECFNDFGGLAIMIRP